MKPVYFLFAFSFIFFLGCSESDKNKNSLSTMNLKGDVKSIKESSFMAINKFGELERGERGSNVSGVVSQTFEFNIFGNIIKKNHYDETGNLSSETVYKYDENNKLVEKKYSSIYSNEIETYIYDKKSLLSETHKNSIMFGEKYGWQKYRKHDSKGNPYEETQYDSDGTLISTWFNKFDKKGNKIEQKRIQSNGKFGDWFLFKYDQYNNMSEVINLNQDSTSNWMQSYKYDLYNNISEETRTMDNSTSTSSYDYKYDKDKNWIERIDYENSIPKYIVERKIEYY